MKRLHLFVTTRLTALLLLSYSLLISSLMTLSSDSFAQLKQQNLLAIDNNEPLDFNQSPQPYGLLKIADNIKYIFWFAMDKGQLFLIEKQGDVFNILKTLDISIGKKGYDKFYEGDKKTPVGLYYFHHFIKDEKLDDFYGIGAYPINYPNNYDKYRKRTGSGIWLHGLPKGVERRPLRDSDGCMVVANPALEALKPYIIPKQTLVINQDYFQWGSPAKTQQLKDSMQANIDDWLLAWNNIDTEKYLTHYSKDFNNRKKDFKTWVKHKQRVNGHKKWINVSIENLSMVLYPGTNDVVHVTFDQDYRSSNYNSTGSKTQLWKRETDGQWRIILERS